MTGNFILLFLLRGEQVFVFERLELSVAQVELIGSAEQTIVCRPGNGAEDGPARRSLDADIIS
jgi:hypothetical protein